MLCARLCAAVLLTLSAVAAAVGCSAEATVEPTESPDAEPGTDEAEPEGEDPTGEGRPGPVKGTDGGADRSDAAAAPGPVKALTLGERHACALLGDGAVKCWGDNDNGQLGDGTKTPSPRPVAVKGITNAVAVSATSLHTCAVLSTGAVKCWGSGEGGALGDDGDADSLVPVSVKGVSNAVSLSEGAGHSCAVLTGGGLTCWPRGVYAFNEAAKLAPVVGASSGLNLLCGLRAAGTMACIGGGSYGDGPSKFSSTVLPVASITNAREITARYNFNCAALAPSGVKCWGAAPFAMFEGGTSKTSNTPATPSTVTEATHIGVGQASACASRVDGSVHCWGANTAGQLGNGSAANVTSATAVAVPDVTGATDVGAGVFFHCALTNGHVMCWGANARGQVGDGSTANAFTAKAVVDL